MTETTKTHEESEDVKFPLDRSGEKDNSADSSTDETNADSTDSSSQDKSKTDKNEGEDDAGFLNHPRWKEREKDWNERFNKQEERHVGELEKFRTEMDEKYGKKDTSSETSTVPAWFGGSEEAWKEYNSFLKKQNEGILTQAEERAMNRITAKATEEQKAIDAATTYFNETLEAIETDKTINPDGIKIDRNKLLKFTLDNDLVDSKGRWNYRAAFQMMKGSANNSKKDTTDERKKIAAATTSENRSETKQSDVTTSADFAKPGARPW